MNNKNFFDLFENSSQEDFLFYIFKTPHFARSMSTYWQTPYINKLVELNSLYNYYHEDDLYSYFKINHVLNKDKTKEDYKRQLFVFVSDLIKDIPDDSSLNYVQLDNSLPEKPIYVYYCDSSKDGELLNIARDFFEYGMSITEIRNKHVFRYKTFIDKLKEISEREYLPLNLSEKSYLL